MKLLDSKTKLYVFLLMLWFFVLIGVIFMNVFSLIFRIIDSENKTLFYSFHSISLTIIIINLIVVLVLGNNYRLHFLKNLKKGLQEGKLEPFLDENIEKCEKFNLNLKNSFRFKKSKKQA